MNERVHAFGDDALGDDDAVGLVERLRGGEVTATELRARLLDYVAFTPLCNVAGAPAISLPAGVTANGLPIGVHLCTTTGDERTLLELAYAVEADRPWRRITDGSALRRSA